MTRVKGRPVKRRKDSVAVDISSSDNDDSVSDGSTSDDDFVCAENSSNDLTDEVKDDDNSCSSDGSAIEKVCQLLKSLKKKRSRSDHHQCSTKNRNNNRKRSRNDGGVCGSKKKRLKKDNTVGPALSRFNIDYFCAVLGNLTDAQKDAIRPTGFSTLLEFKGCKVPRAFVQWIADRVNIRCSDIVVGNKNMPLSAEYVNLVLDIPLGGLEVRNAVDREKTEFLKLFGQSSMPPCRFFGSLLENKELPSDLVVRSFLVVALSTFLCPNSNRFPSSKYVAALLDVQKIREFDWCKFVFDWMMVYLRKHQKGKGKKHPYTSLGGCIYFLAVYYLDCLDFGLRELPRSIPRINVWHGNLVKEYSKMDSKRKDSFGCRPVKAIADTCYSVSGSRSGSSNILFRDSLENVVGGSLPSKMKDEICVIYQRMETRFDVKSLDCGRQLVLDVLDYMRNANISPDCSVESDRSESPIYRNPCNGTPNFSCGDRSDINDEGDLGFNPVDGIGNSMGGDQSDEKNVVDKESDECADIAIQINVVQADGVTNIEHQHYNDKSIGTTSNCQAHHIEDLDGVPPVIHNEGIVQSPRSSQKSVCRSSQEDLSDNSVATRTRSKKKLSEKSPLSAQVNTHNSPIHILSNDIHPEVQSGNVHEHDGASGNADNAPDLDDNEEIKTVMESPSIDLFCSIPQDPIDMHTLPFTEEEGATIDVVPISSQSPEPDFHLNGVQVVQGGSISSQRYHYRLPKRNVKPTYMKMTPFRSTARRSVVSALEKTFYDIFIKLARDRDIKGEVAVNIDKNYIFFSALGDSFKPRGLVANWVVNCFARKFFRECHPATSKKHYFFHLVSEAWLENHPKEQMHYNTVAKDKFIHAASAFPLTKSDVLLFPCLKDDHWFLFVVQLNQKCFVVLDSLKDGSSEFHKKIKPLLIHNFQHTWAEYTRKNMHFEDFEFVYASVPKQHNIHDCSIFVIKFLELWNGVRDPMQNKFSAEDIPNFRIQLANQIFFTEYNSEEQAKTLVRQNLN